MLRLHSHSDLDQVVDTMVGLTRISHLHRVIVAGSNGLQLCGELRRRGFVLVGTPAMCRLSRGHHAVGLITGEDTLPGIISALEGISGFLSAHASIAILIGGHESGFGTKIRARLEKMGFRIEAGVRCRQGLVLSAFRPGFGELKAAA
jgi:hypothetical protein